MKSIPKMAALGLLGALLVLQTRAGETAVVQQNRINVRARATLNSEVITQLKEGEKVEVLEEITIENPKPDDPVKWYRIALPANTPVWVFADFIDANKTVKPNRLNVRAGPGENYSIIGRLEKGAGVREIRVENGWMEIETPANCHAFVAADYVTKEEPSAPPPEESPTPKPVEPKLEEPTPAEPPPELAKPVELEPAPARPAEPKPEAVKPVEAEPKPEKARPAQPKPEALKPAEPKPAEPAPEPAPLKEEKLEPAPTPPPATPPQPPVEKPVPAEPAPPPPTTPPPVATPPPPPPPPTPAAQPQVIKPAPKLPPGPPPKRIVIREGRVSRNFSIQSPTHFGLEAFDTGRVVNYLYGGKIGLKLDPYKGRKVRVTGEEALDKRWPETPVIILETITLMP